MSVASNLPVRESRSFSPSSWDNFVIMPLAVSISIYFNFSLAEISDFVKGMSVQINETKLTG